MAGFRATALGAALGLIAAFPTTAQQQIDLFGVTSATLEWSPASGPVSGYYVIVARNGGAPSLQGVAAQTRTTLDSSYGDVVSVQVAAFGESGVAGPVSAPSASIRFNPPPPSSEPPPPDDPDTTTDPDDGGGGAGGSGDPPGGTPAAAAIRFDWNGDGFSDLLLRDPSSGALSLWKMQGNQVVERVSVTNLPAPWTLEDPGDFDGDGTADILWRNASTGQLSVWLVRADAVASGATLDLGALTSEWTVAGRGDFDGDGREDLALASPQGGVVDLVFMNGTAIAARVSRNAPSDRWRLVATPDADGDGAAELLWQNLDSHALAIESTSAPGRSTPLVAQPGAWRVLGAGDLDGNGRDDLLVGLPHKGQMIVDAWVLDGGRAQSAGWQAMTGSSGWSYRGLGDFDGDGLADAFWHDRGGLVEIWFTTPGGPEPAFVSETTRNNLVAGDAVD